MSGPCSPCGDTAMKYHDHSNVRQFPARLGIAINLDHLRELSREFIDHVTVDEDIDEGNRVGMEWTFETFLQWLRKKQETSNV